MVKFDNKPLPVPTDSVTGRQPLSMKQFLLIFTGTLAVFLLYFLPYPLHGSLTGDLDTIANLAMYKQLQLHLTSWFTGQPTGSVCYPVEQVNLFFGADYHAGILHLLFNMPGMSDLWANWLFLSVIFALNATTFFLLLNHYTGNTGTALVSSLIFCFSHFILANLENPNILLMAGMFLSLYAYEKYQASGCTRHKFLYTATFLAGIQIYFAPVIFLYHAVVWSIVIISGKPWPSIRKKSWLYLTQIVIYLLIVSPYLYFYVFSPALDNTYNLIEEGRYFSILSLQPRDLLRVMDHHLYLDSIPVTENPFINKIRSAYLGIAFYGLAALGAVVSSQRLTWIIVWLSGIVLAIGPWLVLGPENAVPSLMYPFYEFFGFDGILRIPVRAFFIALIAMTVLLAYGLDFLQSRFRRFPVWLLLAVLVFLENIPMKKTLYDHDSILHPDLEFVELMAEGNDEVLLSLPLTYFTYNGDRREYIHMYWQSFHRQHLVNGMLAFIPLDRKQDMEQLHEFNRNNLEGIIRKYGITKVAYHKDLIVQDDPKGLLDSLSGVPFLTRLNETARTVTFDVDP